MTGQPTKSDAKNTDPTPVKPESDAPSTLDTEKRCTAEQRLSRREAILADLMTQVDPATGLLPVKGRMTRDPEKRANQLAALREPWRPGHSPNPRGRPKGPTFAEDARAILDGGVPSVIRDLVAKRTGLPLAEVDALSLRQAVVMSLVVEYFRRGKLDQLAAVIDRTDPKSRRVDVKGTVGHLHAVAAGKVPLTEADAAEIYGSLREGGVVELPSDAVSRVP